MNTYNRGVIAAVICAGALASASTSHAETNWNALKSADWSNAVTAAPAQEEDAMGFAEANPAAGDDFGAAIRAAFVHLGMAEPRAECFGKVLVENLSPEDQQEAAELVRQSGSADEVKVNVIAGGPEMVGGFSAADASCPASIGG
jgi:hypothetical protein